jgi:hypothetical protein
MLKRLHLLSAIISLALLNTFAAAQTQQGAQAGAPPAVTASASEAGARFVAPEGVSQVRLEIYAQSGERVFDSGMQTGSILDWKAQGLADGSYLGVVTVKDLRGKLSQRVGSLSLQAGQVSLSRAAEPNAAQSKTLAAERQARKIEHDGAEDALTVVTAGKERALTVGAHDGRDGQVTSTSGALTFRTGDVLTGADKEQMRVTPEGRVGIGTDKPEDALDVAGTIRARGGIRFEDGTVLTSAGAAKGSTVVAQTFAAGGGDTTISAAGTGTSNSLAKWLDGAGTLGNSSITEVNGNVGVGNPNPTSKLDVIGSLTLRNTASSPGFKVADRVSAPGTQMVYGAAPGSPYSVLNTFVQGSTLANPTLAQFSAWTSDIDQDSNNATQFTFAHSPARGGIISTVAYGAATAGKISIQPNWNGASEPNALVVNTNGNVGVGTASPAQKLEVAGNIKASGVGNGIIFPDGSKQTSAAAAIAGQNAWTGQNTFVNGLSANGVAITNVGNPVSATDATNKAYVDANTVKFVPGAEQLSVGDANGTAPMINLRGGSTCCSGPGGHTPAFFKVFQNGSFVATGNLGIGVSPMEGKGYRTSWHTYKGAFRSGYADNEWDDANVGFFSWAGGSNSTASGLYALAFGDTNSAESTSSIVFGSGNQVKGAAGFSAGAGNRVCDTYGVAFGNKAQSGGPLINGKCDPDSFNIRGLAAVAIGYNVTADQDHTTALGKFATNNGFSGTFIWSDGSATASADTFRNTANNEFAARATGGFRFRTNLGGTTGCNLPAGSGVFNCTSSRTTKENFSLVSGEDVLTNLRKVPVSTWNYIAEGQQSRHLGPMAEDFYGAFKLGTTDKAIGIQDAVGVSLAAVKALDARTLELQQKSEEVEQLRSKVNSLERRLAALEGLIRKQAEGQQK